MRMAEFEAMKPKLEPDLSSLETAMSAFTEGLREMGYLPEYASLNLGEAKSIDGRDRVSFLRVIDRRRNRNTQKTMHRESIELVFLLHTDDEPKDAGNAFSLPDMKEDVIASKIKEWRDAGRIQPHEPDDKFRKAAQLSLFLAITKKISEGMQYDLQRGALYLLDTYVVKRIAHLMQGAKDSTVDQWSPVFGTAKNFSQEFNLVQLKYV